MFYPHQVPNGTISQLANKMFVESGKPKNEKSASVRLSSCRSLTDEKIILSGNNDPSLKTILFWAKAR
jgi:hypothetical protein